MVQFYYEDLQNNLVNWAEAEENVRALLLVGSRARTETPPDQFSDLDVILFCLQPSLFTGSNEWLRGLGPFWFNYLEKHENNEPEQFALYEGALKIDVMIMAIDENENLQSRLKIFPYKDVLQRGFKVLLDKTSSHPELLSPTPPVSNKLPGQAEFDNHIHQGLLLVIKCMRYIERNDLWRAHNVLNHDIKNNLLELLEWEALAANPHTDVWYNGRFINHWGNPEIVSLFPQLFSGYQKEDQHSGLENFLKVFYKLAKSTAEKIGLDFTDKDFEHIQKLFSHW